MTKILQYGVWYSVCKDGVTLKAHRLRVYAAGLVYRPLLEAAMAEWSPATHARFPDEFHDVVMAVLMLHMKDPSLKLPKHVVYLIISRVAAAYAAATHEMHPLESRAQLRKLTVNQLRLMCKERGLMQGWLSLRTGKDKFIDMLLGSRESKRKRRKKE